MTSSQALKGLDKDLRDALKPLFHAPTHFRDYQDTKCDPVLAYKDMLLRRAWQIQESRNG